MRVEIVRRPGVPQLLPAPTCRRVLRLALTAGGAPADSRVTLILSDDAELTALNQAHMGSAGPTDVLSFPLLPPSAFPPHPGQDPSLRVTTDAFPRLPGEALHLGDIVISVERAVQQAQAGAGGQTGDVRWAAADELRLLLAHGALHLCGWDHADPREETAMRALERDLLAATGGRLPEPGVSAGPVASGAAATSRSRGRSR